jgi:uncharacterized iron-regulated membrane protein
MKLRSLVFWPHLIAGVTAGSVIFVMSVTGVLLTYERQMIAWSNGHLRSVPPAAGGAPLPLEDLLATLRQDNPDLTVSNVTLAAEADAPVVVQSGAQTLYVDAYSGRVLGEGATGMRTFMSEVRAWHRWLAADGDGRATARLLTGWSNVVFAFIVLSGIYLWFPRQWSWQRVKPVVFFARRRGKARDFNWHNVIGVWSAVPLFIVVVSAVPISFPWGNDLVYRLVGETPPAGRGGGRGAADGPAGRGGAPSATAARATYAGLNGLVAEAARQEPEWRTLGVRVPVSAEAPVVFAIDTGEGGQPQYRSTLTLDRRGALVARETFSDLTLGRRIRNVMRFAHTGEVLGLPGQTVAGLVSAGGVVLVWTGMALALRRAGAWIRRRVVSRTPAAEEGVA